MRIRVTNCVLGLSKALRGQHIYQLGLDLVRVSALVVVVLLLFSERACASPAVRDLTITARVYNYAKASPVVLAGAEREAGRIIAKAGLNILWLDCWPEHPTTVPQDFCADSGIKDVSVWILRIPIRNTLPETVSGIAMHPNLVTVYYEPALRVAKGDVADFEAPIILGCVIAHEVGHLLLGPKGHSGSGVMQMRWDRKQIKEAMTGAMLFTPEQARLMQAEMQRRMTLTISRQRTAHMLRPGKFG